VAMIENCLLGSMVQYIGNNLKIDQIQSSLRSIIRAEIAVHHIMKPLKIPSRFPRTVLLWYTIFNVAVAISKYCRDLTAAAWSADSTRHLSAMGIPACERCPDAPVGVSGIIPVHLSEVRSEPLCNCNILHCMDSLSS
jgi:hypothetical protein